MTAGRGNTGLVIAAASGALALALVLALRPGVRAAMRAELRQLDAAATGGAVRRMIRDDGPPVVADLPPVSPGAYAWLDSAGFLPIAHALGPALTGGRNGLATFHEGYRRGFRVFEVDLALTSDGTVICHHGESESELNATSYAAYLEQMRARRQKPCVFRDLVALADQYSDARFVLDVKNRFDSAYEVIGREVGEHAGAFVPQVYRFDQLRLLRTQRAYGGAIFTSYRSGFTLDQMLAGARAAGVRAVTLTVPEADAIEAMPQDLAVFVQPVENAFQAAILRRRGARGIYTSYLAPQSVPELFDRWRSGCDTETVNRCGEATEIRP